MVIGNRELAEISTTTWKGSDFVIGFSSWFGCTFVGLTAGVESFCETGLDPVDNKVDNGLDRTLESEELPSVWL